MRNNPIYISRFSGLKFVTAISALVSLILVIGGFIFYNYESNRIKNEQYQLLKAIANIKVVQINQWKNERMADAKHFSLSPLYAVAIEKYLSTRDITIAKDIMQRNYMIKELRGFESVYIVSPDNKHCLEFDTLHKQPDPYLSVYIDSAVQQKKIYFTDFYYYKNNKHAQLAIISPIINKRNSVIATLVFLIDPNIYLFPLIQTWPTTSETSEIILLHRDGDSIMVMNNIKLFKNTSCRLLFPISKANLPGVKAVMGYRGIFEGPDFRNVHVLADIRPISGTPWYMVTKVDKEEFMAELRFRAIVITIIVLILIILLGLITGWYYMVQKNNLYKSLLINEKRTRKIEEEYRITLYSVGDGVISTDMNGLIRQMNREAEHLTGWKESNAQGKPLDEVFRITLEKNSNIADVNIMESAADGFMEGLKGHFILKTNDGTDLPVDSNSALIKTDLGENQGVVIVFKDKSIEREAQKAIAQSEIRLTQAEFISKSGNWELHLASGIIYASLGAQKIYEYDGNAWDLYDAQKQPLPEYREKLDNALKNLIENDEHYNIEFKIRKAITREIIDVHSIATFNKEKNIVFGVIRDITERKAIEESLKVSQQQMNDIIEFLPDAIFAIDLEGKVIAWNRAIQEMTGVQASDMIGKGNYEYSIPFFGKRHPILIDFVFQEHVDQISNYESIKQEKDVLIAESSVCVVNGVRLDLYGKASPLYNTHGEIVGAIELIRDTSEFKKHEELLREKDLIFQSLLEYSPIYVFFKDHDMRAIHLSRNFEKMLGKPLFEILGKTMDEIFPSDLAKSMIEDDKKIVKEGKLIVVDEELGGRYYTTIKFPIKLKDKPAMLAGFTIDITDRKKAEQELIFARDKAERSDKLKDAFLQNMSHEIRTPLNAINGFSELLSENSLSSEKIKSYSSIIVNSSNQLLSIVDDILTVARIQTGQEIANITKVDIMKLQHNLVYIYFPKAESKGITLSFKNNLNNFPLVLQTDGTKLTQILTNLLNNALKFTNQGSIELSCSIKDTMLEFCVKDTGIGIMPEMQESIFGRFIQADISISKKYGGTGLGLSICKAYSELLGGTIWVKSEPDKGSEFYFNIPYNPVNKDIEQKKEQVRVMQAHNRTILIAEDEEANFMLLRALLNNKYTLLRASNGREAVELFLKNPNIDLILMDIKMPEMDGQTAMTAIKKIKPTLPIIAQTAYALDDEKEEFMKTGFDDYITKPINKNELIEKIVKFL